MPKIYLLVGVDWVDGSQDILLNLKAEVDVKIDFSFFYFMTLKQKFIKKYSKQTYNKKFSKNFRDCVEGLDRICSIIAKAKKRNKCY